MIEIVAFLVAILVLVTIHEWGHYWVARRCGVAIEKFSIGFGKPLLSWTNAEGTVFCLAMIPLGGYVKMRGEYTIATSEEQSEAVAGSFAACSVWQRMAIVAAGPLVNLLFAVVVFAGLQFGSVTSAVPYLAKPVAGSALAVAGIEDGDELLALNGQDVRSFGHANKLLIRALFYHDSVQLTVRNSAGQIREVAPISLDSVSLDQADWVQRIGMELYLKSAQFEQVLPQSVAHGVGLLSGDVVLSVDGVWVNGNQFLRMVHNSPGRPLLLQVRRGGQDISLVVTPKAEVLPAVRADQKPETVGRLGVMMAQQAVLREESRGVVGSLALGLESTVEHVEFNLMGLYQVVTGQLSPKNIGGPVSIAKQAGSSAQNGWVQFLGFLAILSVGLGTLNLLPIPVLDGGHLVYYAAEALRGRPVSERVLVIGQRVGLFLIVILMGLGLINDVGWFLN